MKMSQQIKTERNDIHNQLRQTIGEIEIHLLK